MKNFTYYRPTSVDDALGLLDKQWGGVELLAGGTDLLDLQKEYISQPDKVVSITGVKGLDKIELGADGGLIIGALARIADIAESSTVQKSYPGLSEAAAEVGGPQIRNMGTLGGNLCQRNRCWYFRDEHVPCLLKGGDKCYAIDGENRYHAIFTQKHPCVMVSPSTLAPVLIALGASAQVQGSKGKRDIPLAKFFKAPLKAGDRETVLNADDMVLSVTIPNKGLQSASYEIRQKHSYDWPLVHAAVALKMSGGKASDAVVVLGHVGPTPVLAEAAGMALNGKAVSEESATAAGKAAVEGAKPLSQTGYKVQLAQVAVKRAALAAAGAKRYWE